MFYGRRLQVLIHSPIRRAATQSITWKTELEKATLAHVYRPWGCTTFGHTSLSIAHAERQ